MKKAFTVLFFCFLSYNFLAGCGGPSCWTNIGPGRYVGYSSFWTDSALVNPSDSFILRVTGGNCYNLENATIYFNGKAILTKSGNFQIKIPCTPGVYRIKATSSVYNYPGSFTIKLKQKPKDVGATAVDSTANQTFLSKIPVLNSNFLFYPNPTKDQITLINETEKIKQIVIYNSIGTICGKYESNETSITVPLKDFPTGIYFIHVATINDKVIIKKISVL